VIVWTAAHYVLARYEVETAILRGDLTRLRESGSGTMRADLLPSIREGGNCEGNLGEIDQDGYVFTADPRDQSFFPNRPLRNPKRHHRLDLVVRDGTVCVRKTFLPLPQTRWSSAQAQRLNSCFWIEAAALLRLRGYKQVPALRHIDCDRSAIEIEYVGGENLRNLLRLRSSDLSYRSAESMFDNILGGADPTISSLIAAMLREVMGHGVAPRDLHAANFIQARDSGSLYMVDFHLSWLRPIPPFTETAKALECLLNRSGSR
jgi:serine/threonine protein kinase